MPKFNLLLQKQDQNELFDVKTNIAFGKKKIVCYPHSLPTETWVLREWRLKEQWMGGGGGGGGKRVNWINLLFLSYGVINN